MTVIFVFDFEYFTVLKSARKIKILLVDDDEVFHLVNTKMIQLTGIDCEIETATNGLHAMSIIKECRNPVPDYIFIDLNMPVMNGFEFIREFQKANLSNKERVKLIVLTSSSDKRDFDRVAALGIKHFITKPLTEKALRRVLPS